MVETMFTIRLTRELLKRARLKAVENDLPLAEVIRQLLALWLDGKVKVKKIE
jgi:hypothetical protein